LAQAVLASLLRLRLIGSWRPNLPPPMRGFGNTGGKARPQQRKSFGKEANSFDAESDDQLVSRIKEMQKNDPVGKEQWIAFVDQNGDGKRDPTKQGRDNILNFLHSYTSGARLQSLEESLQLPQVTKMLQKRSAPFKDSWARYCQFYGGGTNDPLKHEASFHVQFFEHLAKNSFVSPAQMLGMGMGMGMPSMGMGMGMGMGTGMGTGTGVMDPAKLNLVNRIKNYQKLGQAERDAWCEFSRNTLDPARHDNAKLLEFIKAHDVP